jgi:translocator protein
MTSRTAAANRSVAGLVLWLAACFAAESSAVAFLPGRWYAHLHKASWTPPSYLFAPVWTAMYVIMAIAAWLVWRDGGFRKHPVALGLFLVQLALNCAWSIICFRLHNLPLSVADMALYWVALLITTRAFFKANRAAGWLLVPYCFWVAVAASLDIALWWLNS